MPYIKQEERPLMNLVVKAMADADVRANGDLNYILFAFCKRNITPSYNNYKNFCGELRACATEIERKLLGPWEDRKLNMNGDVD
jgi:hypothetical protein